MPLLGLSANAPETILTTCCQSCLPLASPRLEYQGPGNHPEPCCFPFLVCVCVSHSAGSDSCDPMNSSPPGSFVSGILQPKILEWVAIFFFRGSSQPRDWTQVSHVAGRFFTVWGAREALPPPYRDTTDWTRCRVVLPPLWFIIFYFPTGLPLSSLIPHSGSAHGCQSDLLAYKSGYTSPLYGLLDVGQKSECWTCPTGIELCSSLSLMSLSPCVLMILTGMNFWITPSWTPRHLANSLSSFRSQVKPPCTGIPLTSWPSEFPLPCVLLIPHVSSSFFDFSHWPSLPLDWKVEVSLFFGLKIDISSSLAGFVCLFVCSWFVLKYLPKGLCFLQGI